MRPAARARTRRAGKRARALRIACVESSTPGGESSLATINASTASSRWPRRWRRRAGCWKKEATKVAVVDAFPRAYAAIAGSVAKAIKRGVAVHVQTYEAVEIRGAASHVVAGPGQAVLDFWRCEQLNVIVDGRQQPPRALPRRSGAH